MEQDNNFSSQKSSTSHEHVGPRLERKDTLKGNNDLPNRRKCPDCDGKISKDSSKSKSRVWKKVMWFTRKSKPAKIDVCQCHTDEGFNSNLNERHSNSWSFTRSASRKFRISSRSKRQCKSESSKKSFQFRGKLGKPCTSKETLQPSAMAGSVSSSGTNSPTATGSFCDFASSSHSGARSSKKNKNAIVLTEIAREINPPVKNDVPPLRDIIHHPPKQLSKSSSSVSHISRCCQSALPTNVRRTKSFPGSQINISPSKRRFTNASNKTFTSFSPPLKQKCYGLRRTATFSGKLNMEFPKACIKKSKSVNTAELTRLENATSLGEIRDQSGNIVGVVHFYKSPKNILARRMSSVTNEVKNYDLCVEEEFLCKADQISSNTIPNHLDLPVDKSIKLPQEVENYMEKICGAEHLLDQIWQPKCDVLDSKASVVCGIKSKKTETECFEKPVECFDRDMSTLSGDNANISYVANDESVQDTIFDLVEGEDNINGSKDPTSFSSGSIGMASPTSMTNQEGSSDLELHDDKLIVKHDVPFPSSQSEAVGIDSVGACLESDTKPLFNSGKIGLSQLDIDTGSYSGCDVTCGAIGCGNSSGIPKQSQGCYISISESVKEVPKIYGPSFSKDEREAALNMSNLETVSEAVELPCLHDNAMTGDHYHGDHVLAIPPSVSKTSQQCCEDFGIPCCKNDQILDNRDKLSTKQLCMSSTPYKGIEISEGFAVKTNGEMVFNANGQCTDETTGSLGNFCVRDDKFDLGPEFEVLSVDATILSEDRGDACGNGCLCNEMDITEQFESLEASDDGDLKFGKETKSIHSRNTDSLGKPTNKLRLEVLNSSLCSARLLGEPRCVCTESQNDCSHPPKSDNLGDVETPVMSLDEKLQRCDHSIVGVSRRNSESSRISVYVSMFDESLCRQKDVRNDAKRFASEEEFRKGVTSREIASSETTEDLSTSDYSSMFDKRLPPKQDTRTDPTAVASYDEFQSSTCNMNSTPETMESSKTSDYASMLNERVSQEQNKTKVTQPIMSSKDFQRYVNSSVIATPDTLESSRMSEYDSAFDESLSREQDVPIHTWKNSESSDIKSEEIGLPVPGETFKMRTELLLSWFEEFNDEQRNIILKKILNRCDLPQMHLLSVAMENNLHKTCPPNCQDMLVWLPYTVTLKILMYLDPVSLCRCNQINRAWNELTNNPLLWQRLTGNPDYQLSEASSKRQYQRFTQPKGDIDWKKVFAERFLLQRNWLNGTYKLRTFEGHNQGIACVQFDDTRIVSGSSDKTIKLWDISNTPSELMLTLEGHSGTVRCLDLNGNRLVSGSTDRTIKVWDLSFASYWAGASCKVTMVGHLHTVRCLQADEKKLVSGSYDKTVKVWDLKTGSCQLTLRGHTAAVLCVQFDDQKIVSGSYDKKIKVWDLTEGACLMTLDGHQDAVTCLNLTHDGMKIITGSLDYSLKFWDLSTGKCYGTLDWIRSEGHTAVVRCLQVDSWRIVSGGDDKTLKVWELATGQRLLTLRYHSDGVTCMQFNDFAIVSGSYDRTVKLWDFAPKHPYLEAVT